MSTATRDARVIVNPGVYQDVEGERFALLLCAPHPADPSRAPRVFFATSSPELGAHAACPFHKVDHPVLGLLDAVGRGTLNVDDSPDDQPVILSPRVMFANALARLRATA